jgi:uncharacterized protein (DUF1800 family)
MAGLTGRDAAARTARAGRASKAPKLPPTPSRLRATTVGPTAVTLAWNSIHVRGHTVVYEIFRDGRRIAVAHHHALFTDRRVKPRRTYRYAVRARVGRSYGHRSRTLIIRTPGIVAFGPSTPATMNQQMVDRMFWRAGFGPSAADRQQWIGQPPSALVDHFLTTPYSLAPASSPATYKGNAIDPLASDPELQMEWLDRMQRVTNPLIERMNFFWHRHFAVSRDAGIPSSMLVAYRDRLRRYSDFGANPRASFHDLALEMTTQDAAMSMYLTGFLNRKGSPNENYAREFMELFTLGVTNEQGQPNYTQSDVRELARAFTGYRLDQASGTVSFNPQYYDGGTKAVLGQVGAFDAPTAVAIVLLQASHAPFLVRKLWREFIAEPIPASAEASLVRAYQSSGFQLAPVLRGILSNPLLFASLSEPTMTKPPIVYAVGVLRALGAPLRDTAQTSALYDMQQQPYHPPNVAGWEGGLSWMTTSTSSARFDLVVRSQGLLPATLDVPNETPQAAFARAYATCGSPWISPATRQYLLSYSQQAPTRTVAQRRERQYALCAFILGGPDGQVM